MDWSKVNLQVFGRKRKKILYRDRKIFLVIRVVTMGVNPVLTVALVGLTDLEAKAHQINSDMQAVVIKLNVST